MLSAPGILKGVLVLLTFLGWVSATDGLYMIWNSVADGFFYFLPVVLGYTSAKKFGCSEFTGLTLGIGFTYPAMVALKSGTALGTLFANTPFAMSYFATVLGIPVIMPASGYTASVIPIILAVWVASRLERAFRKSFPTNLQFSFVPLCTVAVMMPVAYLLIGPIASVFTDLLEVLFGALFGIPVVGGLLGGMIMAALWQVLVVFGFHWAVIALALVNFANMGYDFVLSAYMVCSFAQSMAVFAIILRTKDERLKSLAVPAFITGFFFGITEPCIYGVTLPRKKAFVISCIASGIGGAFVGAMGTRIYEWGGGAFFGLPGFIDPSGVLGIQNMVYVCVGIAIASVVSFVMTFMTYRDESYKALV